MRAKHATNVCTHSPSSRAHTHSTHKGITHFDINATSTECLIFLLWESESRILAATLVNVPRVAQHTPSLPHHKWLTYDVFNAIQFCSCDFIIISPLGQCRARCLPKNARHIKHRRSHANVSLMQIIYLNFSLRDCFIPTAVHPSVVTRCCQRTRPRFFAFATIHTHQSPDLDQ